MCQRVVSFLACYLATTVQTIFQSFFILMSLYLNCKDRNESRNGTFFSGSFVSKGTKFISLSPLSRSHTARKLPVGMYVIDSSLQAGFLRKRGSQRSRISLFSVVVRSQTAISLFVGAHISDSFSQSICFSSETNVCIICTLKLQYHQESTHGDF